jgi:hypothetical protein
MIFSKKNRIKKLRMPASGAKNKFIEQKPWEVPG